MERKPSASKKSKKMTTRTDALQALIIEDDPRAIQQASSILNKLGVTQVQSISSIPNAMNYLRGVAEGRTEVPGVLVLDLDFSMESGFEVLRFWKASSKLQDMRVVVWTVMGELEKKISRLFGVENVVDKHLGPGELEKALKWTLSVGQAS